MTRKIRPIRIEGNLAFVSLTRGYEAMVDAADADLVSGYNWFADMKVRADGSIKTLYASRSERIGKKIIVIRMHRVIDGTTPGLETDHRNGNGLDNRRENLRAATKTQQRHNQRIAINNVSGVKGVGFHKARKKWHAYISVGNKQRHVGIFATLEEAKIAREKAVMELHGEFGRVS